MQRRIDAMGPILDAYDTPDVEDAHAHLDPDLSIIHYGTHDNVNLEM